MGWKTTRAIILVTNKIGRRRNKMLSLEEAITWFNAVAAKVKDVPNYNRRRQLAAIILSLFQRAYHDLVTKKYRSRSYVPIVPSWEDYKAAEEVALMLFTFFRDEEERAAQISRLYRQMLYFFDNFQKWNLSAKDVLSFATFRKLAMDISLSDEAALSPHTES
jgi:hypothetical protein